MSRKPSRKKPTAKGKPDPAQLRVIERLLEQEDYHAAVRRTTPLVQRFPNHGGLRRSLVEALHAAEGPSAAGLAAFDWAEQWRNSLNAQKTLLYYAAELYLPALAGRASRRVRELGGDVPGRVPDPTDLLELSHETLDPSSSVEDLERFEIGQLHLAGQDLHGALLRHYGACAACRLGQRGEARRLWREALDIDPDLHLAQTNLGELERAADPPVFPQGLEIQTLFPVQVISILRAPVVVLL